MQDTLTEYKVLCPHCLSILRLAHNPVGHDLICENIKCTQYKENHRQFTIPLMKRGKHEPA